MTTNVNDKIEGVVIVWKQGYGFAKRSNTGEDVFIHRSVLPQASKHCMRAIK